jgi:hypothetical protein
VVSVQNPYNLLNRTFEIGNAEIAIRENVGLLAYSPLAFGAERQIPGRRQPARRAPDPVGPLQPLQGRGAGGRHRRLRGRGPQVRPRPGPAGAGLRERAALRDQQHHRRHQPGAARRQHRQRGRAPAPRRWTRSSAIHARIPNPCP